MSSQNDWKEEGDVESDERVKKLELVQEPNRQKHTRMIHQI